MLNYSLLTKPTSPFYELPSIDKNNNFFELKHLRASDIVETTRWWVYINNIEINREIGWKIHVSATLNNAREVLNLAGQVCLEMGVPFKYIPTIEEFRARNSKYADLASAGKFITVYPEECNFDEVSYKLRDKLKGYNGPVITTDIPSGDAPVYYRYGQFIDRSRVGQWGDVLAGAYDKNGQWTADERKFVTIESINDYIPRSVALAYKDLTDNDLELPFDPVNVLHRSNAGGVYEAYYKGERSVVKEARPYAGLDGAGNYGILRLRNEWRAIKALNNVPGVVKGIDLFEFSEHQFLVEEYIPGDDLYQFCAKRYPFYGDNKINTYFNEVIEIIEKSFDVLQKIHEQNVFLNDVHVRNIKLDESNNPRFIDLESATFSGIDKEHPIATPGAYLPHILESCEYDRSGLALALLHMLHPSTPLSHRDPNVNKKRLYIIGETFGQRAAAKVRELISLISPQVQATI